MPKVIRNSFIACLLLIVTACTVKQDKKVIKLGHGLDVNHSVHLAMVYMAEQLDQLSNGKMGLEIYANQQLGTERQTLELLQLGSLGMTKVSAGTIENFSPKMKVWGIPFLFRDRTHSFAVMDGPLGKELLLDGEKYWLRGLTYYDAGSRSFYTKDRPVHEPSDLEGLKIRVMESISATSMVKQLGGAPTPMSWGEIYTSLQQGQVEGAENNPPSFYLSHHYEVCKYYTLDEHTTLPDILLISTHLWNSFTDQEKEWVQEAADRSAVIQRELWMKSENEALAAVEAAGVEIIRPDKTKFQDKVEALYEGYAKDPVLMGLINRVKEVGENKQGEK